jgi:hypothetical protein
MALRKEIFSTEQDVALLEQLRSMADAEHRSVDFVVEEALLSAAAKGRCLPGRRAFSYLMGLSTKRWFSRPSTGSTSGTRPAP